MGEEPFPAGQGVLVAVTPSRSAMICSAEIRRALLVSAFSVAGTTVLCQTAPGISGRITDENGRPVTGARVELRSTQRRVVSDDEGRFEFRNVAPGRFSLFAQRIGYQPRSVDIVVTESGASTTIVLASIPQVLDSIRIRERGSGMRYSALVLDDNGTPIPDVAVVVAGVENTIRTDSVGRFTVAKKVHGALVLRMRKIGYAAYFGSLNMFSDRADTLRMARLSQNLTPVQITEASGFGRDTFVYKDLDQRTRWKTHLAAIMTTDDLAKAGRANLCQVIGCTNQDCIILNGNGRTLMPVNAYYADQVSTIEIFPRGTDWSHNLEARGCYTNRGRTLVIWMKKDSTANRR
jgi:hypothetical protein